MEFRIHRELYLLLPGRYCWCWRVSKWSWHCHKWGTPTPKRDKWARKGRDTRQSSLARWRAVSRDLLAWRGCRVPPRHSPHAHPAASVHHSDAPTYNHPTEAPGTCGAQVTPRTRTGEGGSHSAPARRGKGRTAAFHGKGCIRWRRCARPGYSLPRSNSWCDRLGQGGMAVGFLRWSPPDDGYHACVYLLLAL